MYSPPSYDQAPASLIPIQDCLCMCGNSFSNCCRHPGGFSLENSSLISSEHFCQWQEQINREGQMRLRIISLLSVLYAEYRILSRVVARNRTGKPLKPDRFRCTVVRECTADVFVQYLLTPCDQQETCVHFLPCFTADHGLASPLVGSLWDCQHA